MTPKISKDLLNILATPSANFTPIGDVSAEKTVTKQKKTKNQ